MKLSRVTFATTLAFLGLIGGVANNAIAAIIVSPNANVSVDGNIDNRFPLLVNGGMRYQQVYSASDFSPLTNPELITQIAVRPDSTSGGSFSQSISDLSISLSTTSAAPDALNSIFANNIGIDVMQVFSGGITLNSSNSAGAGSTRAFDVVIPLQTAFLYDPTAGNLLLDITNSDPGNNVIGIFFDAVNISGDSVSRVVAPQGNPGATSGTPSTAGLVTQFTTMPTTVPEPMTVALLGLGTVGIGYRRRKVAKGI